MASMRGLWAARGALRRHVNRSLAAEASPDWRCKASVSVSARCAPPAAPTAETPRRTRPTSASSPPSCAAST